MAEVSEGAAKGVEARTLWTLNRLMVLLGIRAEKADKFCEWFQHRRDPPLEQLHVSWMIQNVQRATLHLPVSLCRAPLTFHQLSK